MVAGKLIQDNTKGKNLQNYEGPFHCTKDIGAGEAASATTAMCTTIGFKRCSALPLTNNTTQQSINLNSLKQQIIYDYGSDTTKAE